MAAFLNTLSNLFTLTFVITSMLAMGLSLTMPQILAPLRNGRLVALALAANLVVVPATGFLLSRIIPLDADLQIGLILFGCAAGAPTLPKLAQIAKADIAFAVGLMALLVVATVVYLPLVLPLLLPGVSVDAGKVALTLFLEMLAPLGIGLLINARYKDVASALRQPMMQISNISLALLLVLVLGLNLGNVLGLLGSGAIIGIVVLIAVALGAGYLLGGPRADTRQVLAIGTGERGVAAAFVIATGNFADRPDVLVFLAAAGLIMLGIVMPLAAEVGRRSGAARTAPAMAPEPERVLTTAIRQEGAPDAPAMG
ncbi:MAG TPA: bile acid:sodium symporter [Ktedonobacterales bacterium]|jgi:BASS family bile acid:Na+ symporter